MDIRISDKRLQTHSPEEKLLVRMKSIIKNNRLTYDISKKLTTDYRHGLIPAGYIGHKYLPKEIGYRIISSYGNGDGFICRCYPTALEAWNDLRIQSYITTAGVQYADYDTYLHTVDGGHPWTLMGLTILHCRITVRGKLLAVKKPTE
jgi:hypothetical protein